MKIDFTPDPPCTRLGSAGSTNYAGQMHYVDEGGAGTPILFCHGNPTWSFLYRNVIIRLRRHFRCIAVDYLGFGLSERPEAYGYTIEEHAAVSANWWSISSSTGSSRWARTGAARSASPSAPHEPSASSASSSVTRGSGPSTSWGQSWSAE